MVTLAILVASVTLAILVASVLLIHLVTGSRWNVAGRAVLGMAGRAIRDVLAWLTRTGAYTDHEDQ